MDDLDTAMMRRALALAEQARGWTSPNPMVGAVVVKDGSVIGEGYHRAAGEPHAEVEALGAAGESARGGTVYVTLEPCNHFGRTPPCVDALIEAGVARVVYAVDDPGAESGGGAERLRESGIEVTGGVLEAEARRLNEGFLKRAETGLPFVILKAGMTLDGKIAGPRRAREQITCEESARSAHQLRAHADVVMVGIGTVLADNPRLDARYCDGPVRQPKRVVVDSLARMPIECALLAEFADQTAIAVGPEADPGRAEALRAAGAEVIACPAGTDGLDLAHLLRALAEAGTLTVLVEGGSRLHASFLREDLADKVVLFIAPALAGEGGLSVVGDLGVADTAIARRLGPLSCEACGRDLRVEAYLEGRA